MNDRRQAPRRQEEVVLHVAELGLMAAALKVASCRQRAATDELLPSLQQLDRAAAGYLTAERDAVAARQEVTS